MFAVHLSTFIEAFVALRGNIAFTKHWPIMDQLWTRLNTILYTMLDCSLPWREAACNTVLFYMNVDRCFIQLFIGGLHAAFVISCARKANHQSLLRYFGCYVLFFERLVDRTNRFQCPIILSIYLTFSQPLVMNGNH